VAPGQESLGSEAFPYPRPLNSENFFDSFEKNERFLPTVIAKPGRPAYQPTEKDRKVVVVMAGFGIPQATICLALGLKSAKTLRRHFKNEIKTGAAQVEAELVGNLLKLSNGTDGTALKATMFALQSRFGWSQYAPPPPKEKPLGKKEQLEQEALSGHTETTWGDLLQ